MLIRKRFECFIILVDFINFDAHAGVVGRHLVHLPLLVRLLGLQVAHLLDALHAAADAVGKLKLAKQKLQRLIQSYLFLSK